MCVCVCVWGGGGGSRKCSSGKPLKLMLLHVSICSKLVRNFSNTLGFASLCLYASLLNYDIFIQPSTIVIGDFNSFRFLGDKQE